MGDEDKSFGGERRVRIHFAQSAKGAVQLDVTAEAGDVETASVLLGNGLKALEAEVAARGLKTEDKA